MRKLTVIAISAIVVFLNGNVLKAQGKYGADSAECIKYLSYYKEYFKQKNYQEALPNWRKAYKLCPPTANQTMLIDGTTLIRRLIGKNTTNVKYRNSLIDTLMTLHETRAKYYPKYAVTALNNKGTDMSNYMKNNPEALYKGLSDIIKRNKNQTKTSILLFNLNSAISLYQEGKLSTDDVIATYQRDMAILDASNPASESEREMNSKVKSDMEGLFISSKVASCDNLIALFTPRYEADPKNIDLVTNIVKMMSSTEDCTNNDLYLKAATSMHKLQPTAQSAYFLPQNIWKRQLLLMNLIFQPRLHIIMSLQHSVLKTVLLQRDMLQRRNLCSLILLMQARHISLSEQYGVRLLAEVTIFQKELHIGWLVIICRRLKLLILHLQMSVIR